MQLRLTCSAAFSKSPLNFTMYFRPLVKRPQRISTEKMFFFKNGMVGSSSQVKWCLQTKYQLLTRNLKICDGHPNCSNKITYQLLLIIIIILLGQHAKLGACLAQKFVQQTLFDADFEGLASNAEVYIFNQDDSQEQA